jgi:protein-tyrosine phosphatase
MNYFTAKGIAPVPFMERHILSVGPRPSNKLLADMRILGVTDLVTLLSETEGAEQIGQRVIARDVAWHWMPLRGADLAQIDPVSFKSKLTVLAETYRASRNPCGIHVHCSAGIHRTGMVAYGLLRLSGLAPDQALAALKRIRPVTAEGVTDDRLAFVDQALV